MIFWDSTDDIGIRAVCSFNPKRKEYTVTVTKDDIKLQETWLAFWGDPRFGMDMQDQAKSAEVAERLAADIDKTLEERNGKEI